MIDDSYVSFPRAAGSRDEWDVMGRSAGPGSGEIGHGVTAEQQAHHGDVPVRNDGKTPIALTVSQTASDIFQVRAGCLQVLRGQGSSLPPRNGQAYGVSGRVSCVVDSPDGGGNVGVAKVDQPQLAIVHAIASGREEWNVMHGIA